MEMLARWINNKELLHLLASIMRSLSKEKNSANIVNSRWKVIINLSNSNSFITFLNEMLNIIILYGYIYYDNTINKLS